MYPSFLQPMPEGGMFVTGGPPGTPQGMQQGGAGNPAPPSKLGPGEVGALENAPALVRNVVERDGKMVDEDLAHVIDNTIPAKQQLFQLRTLNPDADTGAAGQFRSEFKNWVQTFAPDFVSQIAGDATPMQEFNKIALMGAGKQERGDLGARGGFKALELYMDANPNLEMQPTANKDMANALLVTNQMHEDYARGATDFYNKQFQNLQQSPPGKYQRLGVYDNAFIEKMRPELYASAISAINGKPYEAWSKGLTGPQMQIVGGILQRTDPNAQVDVKGHMIPVTQFTKTIAPTDIANAP
jgi:hypothetical protein